MRLPMHSAGSPTTTTPIAGRACRALCSPTSCQGTLSEQRLRRCSCTRRVGRAEPTWAAAAESRARPSSPAQISKRYSFRTEEGLAPMNMLVEALFPVLLQVGH